MVRTYTAREKQQLIARYKIHLQHRLQSLENQRKVLPNALEMKLKRRLDRVLRRLWDVKMRDILSLEREQKIQMLTLFKDLELIKQDQIKELEVNTKSKE